MSHPRDHHFVPVFYLNRWAGNDGKLVEYSKPRDRIWKKRVGPRATGYQRDLYSFVDLPPDTRHYLETIFLQSNDDEAARALRMLLGEVPPEWTPKTRSSWSRFLLGFLIRHPDPFQELKGSVRRVWLKTRPETEAAYQAARSSSDPPTLTEYILAQGPELSDKVSIRMLQATMEPQRVGHLINNMIWDVLDVSASDYSLLTSDWPLDRNLAPANGYIALPIGPHKLFVGAKDVTTIRSLRRTPAKSIVQESNKLVVRRARRYVWATDERQARFIENHMSLNAIGPPFFPTVEKEMMAAEDAIFADLSAASPWGRYQSDRAVPAPPIKRDAS